MTIKTFTSGEILTASDTNTYLANSGLVFISETTIGSAVASISVDNCFSSTFDNYRVLVRIADASTSSNVDFRYRVASVDNTALVYNWFYVGLTNASGSLNNASAGQSYAFTGTNVTTTGLAQPFQLDFHSPFLTEETRTYGFGYSRAGAGFRVGGTAHTSANSFDGFTLIPSAGTYTGGTITVYGYRKA